MAVDASQVTLEVDERVDRPTHPTIEERQDSMKNNILVLLKPNQTKKEQYTEMLSQYQEICEKL